MNSYPVDRQFSDKYLDQIKVILKLNASKIIDVVIASDEEDMHHATDYILKIDSGTVACRLRRWSKYTVEREWTVRSKRDSGAETELSKLKKGFARWYLYGWLINGKIESWMLIDLDKVRSVGILDKQWIEKSNRDGTWFIIIPNVYLNDAGCIISSCKLNTTYQWK